MDGAGGGAAGADRPGRVLTYGLHRMWMDLRVAQAEASDAAARGKLHDLFPHRRSPVGGRTPPSSALSHVFGGYGEKRALSAKTVDTHRAAARSRIQRNPLATLVFRKSEIPFAFTIPPRAVIERALSSAGRSNANSIATLMDEQSARTTSFDCNH